MDRSIYRLPFSLNLEVDNGRVLRVIKKNTPLPVKINNLFTTINKGQLAAEIHLLKGEHSRLDHNETLGRFLFPCPVGNFKPEIEIQLEVDIYGFIHFQIRRGDDEFFALLSDLSLTELVSSLPAAEYRSFLKKRLYNLLEYLGSRALSWKPAFREELAFLETAARRALISGNLEEIKAVQVSLDVMVNELFSL